MKLLMRNYHYICALRDLLSDSVRYSDQTSRFVLMVIADHLWKRRFVKEVNKKVLCDQFCDFVQTPPPVGLGATVEHLKPCCAGNPEILRLIDRELKKGNITNAEPGPFDLKTFTQRK